MFHVVAPFTGAWIEMFRIRFGRPADRSLPSRERGLKFSVNVLDAPRIVSLPSRERGLKSCSGCWFAKSSVVAPFSGAWIEIVRGD